MVIFANNIVTIFNRWFDDDTETEIWYPTLLTNVNLTITKGANITKTGIEDADTSKLYFDNDSFTKPFISSKEWNALPNKSSAFTFEEGQDFFIEGNHLSEDIPEEGFFEEMLEKYNHVFRVTTVDSYDDIMPHWEVGGK